MIRRVRPLPLPKKLHRWPTTVRAAIRLQQRLADQVVIRAISALPRRIAGADVAFSPDGRQVIAGVVLWDREQRLVIEQRIARRPCRFPYVPGLLSFRELPAVLAAFRTLQTPPDAVLCDAQGLAHPRRLGLACHLGLWLGVPTVGCAKSRLCGEYVEPGPKRGDLSQLTHRGERVGAALRTRDRTNPLFVSAGHLCDEAWAVRLTLACLSKFRLPEPTRLAHQLVTRERVAPIRL